MKSRIFDFFTYTIISCIIVVLVYSLTSLPALPQVRVSHSTGECVEVINYDKRFNYTCETLPGRYEHVWVQ